MALVTNGNRNFGKALIRRLPAFAVLGLVAGVLFMPEQAHAAAAGPGLEWEAPLAKFAASLKGPVAYGISLIGMVVMGGMLIFGGELNEFSRKGIFIVLVISVLAFATNLLSSIFGYGALVGALL